MATRTKSLVSAVTLASAAAVAVAGTAIVPSLNVPTPHALSAAKVQLATFADVLSVPTVEWTDLLFGNTTWGGVLTSTNYGDPSAEPQDAFGQAGYVNPWAVYCDGTCTRSGIPGVAYLFTDALVNGNGLGYDNSSKWGTGVVNYFWEPSAEVPLGGGSSPTFQIIDAGFSAATWYLAQTTLGKAVPALTVPLAAAFWGERNVSVFYTLGLSIVAGVIGQVPGVGPFAGNSILAYLGDLEIPNSGGSTYQYGLSGTLNYWIDIATGAVPFPTQVGSAAAVRTAAAVAAPAAAAASVTAPTVKAAESTSEGTEPADTKGSDVKGSDDETSDNKSGSDTKGSESTPSTDASDSTDTPDTKGSESTPEVKTPEATETKTVDTSSVTDSTPPADNPAPAKPSRPHPLRDAVEKVGNQINSAINDAKAKQAERAAERAARKAAKNG